MRSIELNQLKYQMIELASRLLTRNTKLALFALVPKRLQLPLYYWLHLHESYCENELKYLNEFCKGTKVAVDVGANVGFYSYALSKKFCKTYAFEVNSKLINYLKFYNSANIEVINKGLSSRSGNATLYIPIRSDGYAVSGYASLQPNNYPEAAEHQEINVSLCTLDEFNLLDVEFIKIDVEGHELEVLNGSIQRLIRCRPIVLIEIKYENLVNVFNYFDELGYSRYQLEDLIKIVGSTENYIFLPNTLVCNC